MSEQRCDSCLENKETGTKYEDGYWYCSDCTEEIDCQGKDCYETFMIKDFAHIDDEYDEGDQLCPGCSAEL